MQSSCSKISGHALQPMQNASRDPRGRGRRNVAMEYFKRTKRKKTRKSTATGSLPKCYASLQHITKQRRNRISARSTWNRRLQKFQSFGIHVLSETFQISLDGYQISGLQNTGSARNTHSGPLKFCHNFRRCKASCASRQRPALRDRLRPPNRCFASASSSALSIAA